MASCPACAAPVAEPGACCSRCGAELASVSATPTGTAPRPAAADSGRAAGSRPPSGSAASAAGRRAASRFESGALVADRYRIVGLLGRGAMGEVYRADDLKLDQPVALKFLHDAVQQDAERRERFYNEVRLARRITHAAVCRVHDLGEVDGLPFLSMEYVDGEDVASLLRRIGRLPGGKALEIARQICAGLAAAHARGVLHRDLKPSNVMLDGTGHARITDFGLAGLGDALQGEEVRSGTPAYMSPEQLEGREVSVRSDVYALGLVIYELFTGRRAFQGRTVAELTRQHREEAPPPPSELVPDLDPRVEAVILRCLEKDPARRPASALAVSATLPGGDPLAEALAAGETPSPELVAAAGAAEGRPDPRAAWTRAALAAAGVLAALWLVGPLRLSSVVPVQKAPAVLEDRARQLVARLGYADSVADSASGFAVDGDYFVHVRERESSPTRWLALATGAPRVLHYYLRTSPQPMTARSGSGMVVWGQPPLTVSGMTAARFDLRGRLVAFYGVPPQSEVEGAAAEPDWVALFAEASLDPGAFRPTAPRWTPPTYADARAAWEGAWPERPELPLRVEAAAYRGRPVMFALVSPWTRPEREEPHRMPAGVRAAQNVMIGLFACLLCAAAVLARRNLQLGRGDRRGAFRIALCSFAAAGGSWLLQAHHVSLANAELGLAVRGLGDALVVAAVLWLFYLAIEPYVRRLWPQRLVSWTRLLATGPRDPVVAHDLLTGVAAGAWLAVAMAVVLHLPRWIGRAASEPDWTGLDALLGWRYAAADLLGLLSADAGNALGAFLALVLLRLLLRNAYAAALVFAAGLGYIQSLRFDLPPALGFPLGLLVMGALTLVAVRWGLLAFATTMYVLDVLLSLPLVWPPTGWVGEPTRICLLTLAALTTWGVRTALAGPRLAVPR
jgi:serine/threonine-protein kinase